MKIIEEGKTSIVKCDKCNTQVEVEVGDLRWTHTEPDYYYVKCPICQEVIWIKGNDFWDDMWSKAD